MTELDERTAGGFEEQSDRTLDLHSAMETRTRRTKPCCTWYMPRA